MSRTAGIRNARARLINDDHRRDRSKRSVGRRNADSGPCPKAALLVMLLPLRLHGWVSSRVSLLPSVPFRQPNSVCGVPSLSGLERRRARPLNAVYEIDVGGPRETARCMRPEYPESATGCLLVHWVPIDFDKHESASMHRRRFLVDDGLARLHQLRPECRKGLQQPVALVRV